jgi:hypothetical protein
VTSAGLPRSRRHGQPEGSVSDSDLLVLAPWAIFIAGVALLVVRTVTRGHGDDDRRGGHRRGRFRRR